MINTINDAKTIAASGKDVILAGRYHIIRQLGQGGMGAVWLAEDRQLDNRKVAIMFGLFTLITEPPKEVKGERNDAQCTEGVGGVRKGRVLWELP